MSNCVILNCKEYGIEYEVPKKRAETSKYCSRRCHNKGQTIYKEESKPCSACGKSVKITKHNRKSKKVYCNKECLAASRNYKKIANCENCGKEFTSKYKSETGKYTKFCSKKCYKEHHNETVTCSCCGKQYERNKWISDAGRAFNYCSFKCQKEHFRGENHGNYNRSNEYVLSSGAHRQVRTKDGWRQEHRVLVEEFIGRKLIKNSEPVLHINGNNLDNRLENLYVCKNNSEMAVILKSYSAPYPVSSNLTALKEQQSKGEL